MRERFGIFMIISVVVSALLATHASAQPVSEGYAIDIENDGTPSSTTGTWHEYPGQRYFMWVHTTGLDTDRMGAMELGALIKPLEPTQPVTCTISYGWTKETWTNTTAPPVPPLSGNESEYFTESTATSMSDGTWYIHEEDWTHVFQEALIQEFHPEWVYVSISGTNVKISGALSMESITEVAPTIGACCRTSTGDCYLTDAGGCTVGYIYLGDDTTCSSCQVQSFATDYGDAPPSYPVIGAQDGARHTIESGMYLGLSVTGESDGQPSANANTDSWDDGVAFNSQILSGLSTSVTITASVFGAINAWLDLNADGDWDDIGEHIIVDEPVTQGQNTMSFYVPVTATPGQSFARFRYNSTGGIDFRGLASEGEVEDYAVTIVSGSDPTPDPDPDPNPGITLLSPDHQLGSKWFQPIDLLSDSPNFAYGWNIVTRQDSIPLIADDWRSGSALPVQGFRWWGAFDNWLFAEMPAELPIGFHFGIWSHNPILSKPGTLIWEHTETNWVWAYAGQVRDAQGQLGGESVFEFTSLMSQDEWFYPQAIPDTIYWLSIVPIYPNNVVSSTPWGWMTRQTAGTLPAERILTAYDPVQWPPVLGASYGGGSPVTYPATTNWDVAFELITSQPGGGSDGSNSDLEDAIGDLNDDGKVDIDDLYILLGFVLNP